MTPEELNEIITKVTEALTPKMAEISNAAATAHLKRFEKELEKKAPPPQEPAKAEAPKEVTEKIKATPEMSLLQQQIEDMKKAYETEKAARAKAEEKARNDAAYGKLKSALSGVKPDLQEAAAKLLFHVEQRVVFDEAGNPLFKMKRETAPGFTEDVELPLEAGVEHWVKSKDAAPFLPAPAGGTRGGRAPVSVPSGRNANGMPIYDTPAASDEEKVNRAAEREAALKRMGINL